MLRIKFDGMRVNKLLLGTVIWLLAFQNPLEEVSGVFSYVDEFVGLAGVVCCAINFLYSQTWKLSRNTWAIIGSLALFVLIGLLGNIWFHYQPLAPILIDLFTNLKFFFAISAGYYLFGGMEWKDLKRCVNNCGRAITIILSCIFLLDRIYNFWPAEVRYGIKSAVLFFSHPTYLAGAMAFLIVILTIAYEKQNIPYIAMAVLMMCFSLRSKAIVSAIVYVLFFVFFLLKHEEIKMRHLAVMAGACVAFGWPMFRFYYIDFAGKGTRAVLTSLSITVMRDHFPIGTGFGTFASSAAEKYYSAVYQIYDLAYLCRFDGGWRGFLSDTFWPIIIGQGSILGLIAFVVTLCLLVKRCFELKSLSHEAFAGALYIFAYLAISSTSEAAFHNAVAIPLALVLGILFAKAKTSNMEVYLI